MATENFAKLFDDEEYGQILVMIDENDDGDPCVKFMAQPPGLGVCAATVSFHKQGDAQAAFERVQHEQARAGVADLWQFSETFQ